MSALFMIILVAVFVTVASLQIFTLRKISKEANSPKTHNDGKS